MRMIAYAPFEREIDRLFDEAVGNLGSYTAAWVPRYDLAEDAEGFYVDVEVPGMERKDITVSVDHGVVTIAGERKVSGPDKERRYLARDLARGTFSKSFRLPEDANPEKATATYKDGILRMIFPKREETKARRIEIA